MVSMDSFLKVTGPKTDLWLVITVGLLLAAIGAVLCISGINRRTHVEFAVLGAGMAASLAIVDISFVINGTISAIYLLDAFFEFLFLILWVIALMEGKFDSPVR